MNFIKKYFEVIEDGIKDSENNCKLHGDIFTPFQYPTPIIDYYNEQTFWLSTYLYKKYFRRNSNYDNLGIPCRWKYLNPEHIKNKTILDLGCNTGTEIYEITKNLDPKFVVGVDRNIYALKICNIFREMHGIENIHLIKWDLINSIFDIPFKKKFDVITLMSSIYHFYHMVDKNLKRHNLENTWIKNVTILLNFIKENTIEYFYFISLEEQFFNMISKIFGIENITVIDISDTRLEMSPPDNNGINWEKINSKKRVEKYSGYVKFNSN